uniref:G-protein coupled receptors family 1 profile domain-containing protein n=1 Tax=Plectus sambesii TaxID=2011161 RepID=A0A914XEJ6_9BILA
MLLYATAYLNLFLYLTGTVAHMLLFTAVFMKAKWRSNPGLVLIASLTVCELMSTISFSVAMLETIVSRPLTPTSAYTLGKFINTSWLASSLHISAMAFNRFIGIVFPFSFERLCSPRRTLLTALCIWSFVAIYRVARTGTCCSVAYDRRLLVFRYYVANGSVNYMSYIDQTVTYSTSIISLISYTSIVVKLSFRRNSLLRRKERALCFQFAFGWLSYTLYSASLFITPSFLSPNMEICAVLAVVASVHWTINPYMYFTFNETVQKAALQFLSCQVPCVADRSVDGIVVLMRETKNQRRNVELVARKELKSNSYRAVRV